MAIFSQKMSRIDTENAFKVGPYIPQVEKQGHKVIKCNLGEPDFPLPKHIAEAIKRAIDEDKTHYSDPQGILPLRKAIAHSMSEKRGIEIVPEQVVVFPGAKPPIGFCMGAYCDPGDEVIYPSPGFPIYESFIPYFDLEPMTLHLNEKEGFSFTAKELAPLITKRTKMLILNFPSNPTGGVATQEQLADIARLILDKAQKDIRIYSDEVYENILFDNSRHYSIASCPGMRDKTVIISGVSKTYSWTGGRLGWAAFPTVEEALAFKNLNINYFSCVSEYNQIGATVAIESPESPACIMKMVMAFQDRRDVVVNGLNAIAGIECKMPKGAFYVFPNIAGVCEKLGAIEAYRCMDEELRVKTSPSTLFQMFLLFQYHVATMDRKSFGRIGTEGMHFLRLSIATGLEDLKIGLEKIEKAAADVDGFQRFVEKGEHLY